MRSAIKVRITRRSGISIQSCMTPSPLTIGAADTLERAHRLMRDHGIRHLPVVLESGRLTGIISQRDLALIESLPDVDAREVPVEDAMRADIYAVRPTAPLATVAAAMARRKLGSAVVMDGDRIVGVFTVTDACRVLARLAAPARRPRARAAGRRSA